MVSAEPRFAKRIHCKLRKSRRTFAGLVLNVSRTGLFVRTSVVAKAEEELEVLFSRREPEAAIVLSTQVAWQRKVPPQLRSALEGGLGLQIRYAPESYYVLLAEAAQGSKAIQVSAV